MRKDILEAFKKGLKDGEKRNKGAEPKGALCLIEYENNIQTIIANESRTDTLNLIANYLQNLKDEFKEIGKEELFDLLMLMLIKGIK